MGAIGDEYSHRKTLNFNKAVTYLLEAGSLKKLLDSSPLGDQVLTVMDVVGKKQKSQKEEGQEK